jgi:dipeptide transport system substrate-binding protein
MLGGREAAPPPFDAAAAAQAVATAEADGATLPIWSLEAIRPYSPDPGRMAEMISADLAAAGLAPRIVTAPADTFLADTVAADREGAVLLGWVSDNGDPDNLLAPMLSCDALGIANRAKWCEPRFDALLAEARAMTDGAARARLYAAAAQLVADDAPIIPLLYAGHTVAVRDGVTGTVVDPFGRHNFASVGLTTAN